MNSTAISVFGYEKKEKYQMYASEKCFEERHVNVLFDRRTRQKGYVLINDFNTFMYDHRLHRGRKHAWFQAFSTKQILKCHVKDWIKINDKQKIKTSKKSEYVILNNYVRKIKSPSMIYVDFESILVLKDNGKQNTDKP